MRPWLGLLVFSCLALPSALRADVFVTEPSSGQVSLVDSTTNFVATVHSGAEQPVDVVVLPSLNLLVAERVDSSSSTGRLTELDRSDGWSVVQSEEPGFSPNGLHVLDDGTLFVATAAHGVMTRGPEESSWSLLSDPPGEVMAITAANGFLFVAVGSPTALYRIDPYSPDPDTNFTWLLEVPSTVALVPSPSGILCGTTDDTVVSVASVYVGGVPYTYTLSGVEQPVGFTLDPWGRVHVAHQAVDGNISRFHPAAATMSTMWMISSELVLPGGLAWDPVCSSNDYDGDGSSPCDGDCNDTNSNVYPGAFEQCDGKDTSCDGLLDTDTDIDLDYSLPCTGDCNDNDPATYPWAEEVCGDGVDQDCNGEDLLSDVDQDGWVDIDCGGLDCNDLDPGVHPDAIEGCDDGFDQDCDGEDLLSDGDGDGFISSDCGGNDCDDEDAETNPDVTYECEEDIDRNCNGQPGESDLDGDGFVADECGGDDCNDQEPEIHPGPAECQRESESGVDFNCDDVVQTGDTDSDGGMSVECGGDDCDDEDPERGAFAPELCNGIDDDCDGEVDNGFEMHDNVVDCEPSVAPGFSVPCACDSAPSPSVGWTALLLAGLSTRRRRRRRRGPGDRRPSGLATTALISAAAALLLSPPARTQEAAADEEPDGEAAAVTAERVDRAAMAAFSIHQQWCADTAGESTTTAANALAAVGPVYADVSSAYDESGDVLLLYWRGLLGTCMGQGSRALDDLRAFEADEGTAATYPGLARDAHRRVSRGERRQALYQGGLWDTNPWPTVMIGVGGGGQALMSVPQTSDTWGYFTLDLDVSIRIIKPLRAVVVLRPALSDRSQDASGEKLNERSIFPEAGAGVMLRAPGPIRPSLALFARFAAIEGSDPAIRVLAGPALRVALDFAFGRVAPLAIRVSVDAGLLAGPDALMVSFRGGAWLVLAVGKPAE